VTSASSWGDGGALGGTRTPTFRSVDTSVGVRPRSDQFVTSGLSLPVVHMGPEHPKVVHSCGSQRGSQPDALRGDC
jgi:hypothetical protein